MKKLHFIMQGKGGVGKTLVSSVLAQYYLQNGSISAIDTDPVNKSFCNFKKFNAFSLPLLEEAEIRKDNFDIMIGKILETDAPNVIIDNGASSFVPLNKYLLDTDCLSLFQENDCEVYLHSIVVGGQGLADTVTGLSGVLSNFTSSSALPRFAVWLNPFFGKIESAGKSFKEFGVYEKAHEQINYIIEMPDQDRQLFGNLIANMLKSGQTFDEAYEDSSLLLPQKHRIKITKQRFFDAIQKAGL